MKNKPFKLFTTIMTLIIILSMSASAMALTIGTAINYNIPNGSSVWNGHSNDQHWYTGTTFLELKFDTSITNSQYRCGAAMLYKYRYSVLLPDIELLEYSIAGSNGDWNTQSFDADAQTCYYAKI